MRLARPRQPPRAVACESQRVVHGCDQGLGLLQVVGLAGFEVEAAVVADTERVRPPVWRVLCGLGGSSVEGFDDAWCKVRACFVNGDA